MSCHKVAAQGAPPKLTARTKNLMLSGHPPVTAQVQYSKLTAIIGRQRPRVEGPNAVPQVKRNHSNIENLKVRTKHSPATLILLLPGSNTPIFCLNFVNLTSIISIVFSLFCKNYCCILVIHFYIDLYNAGPFLELHILLVSQDSLCIHPWFRVGKHVPSTVYIKLVRICKVAPCIVPGTA